MANRNRERRQKNLRKARSVRAHVRGSADKPRLSVFRSSKFISCQAIDDTAGRTLAAAAEVEAALKERCKELTKTEAAKVVGAAIAERLKEQGVARVVFDRGWYRYHGRIKALADAAREAGLKF